MPDLAPLKNGATVAVVGGGPAGSFFALTLLSLARAQNLKLTVDIYDEKKFLQPGPGGCNMCAGVIGHNFAKAVEELLGHPIPAAVIKQDVAGYTLHLKKHFAWVKTHPPEHIYTVFRSVGPRLASADIKSFDQFLLDEAVGAGANFHQARVNEIGLPKSEPAILTFSRNEAVEHKTYDLIVGAFGVNSPLAQAMACGYRPPKVWRACQAEITLTAAEKYFIDQVHIFSLGHPEILFTSLTPKYPFLTVSAIGRDVRIETLKEQLSQIFAGTKLAGNWKVACACRPCFPVTLARQPFADRLVIIGDAAASRYLKNGIESALFTATVAAKTVMSGGISAKIFKKHYYKACRRRFAFDNIIAKFLFTIYHLATRSDYLARVQIDLMKLEQTQLKNRLSGLSEQLWHLFTGDKPYLKILLGLLNPKLQLKLFGLAGKGWLTQKKLVRGRLPTKRLTPHTRIAVIGGGPAGSALAIRLLKGASERGLNPEVKIFEGKDFDRHYNQCVGVLSPPLTQILKEKLDLDLPAELIKRTISAYRLYADNEFIHLPVNTGFGPTYTVRRVKLDQFLLDTALKLGTKLERSRVDHLEFVGGGLTDEVHIYCEAGFYRADAVVLACGMDHSTLKALSLAAPPNQRYQSPKRVLKTVIVKLHVGPEFVEKKVGDTIHAFLPSSLPNMAFGAVTPKGDHIIINIAGRNIGSADMDQFLALPPVQKLLPKIDFENLTYFMGEFPCAPCQNAFGDRYVVVGDATGWLRPFKGKGLNTAVLTGIYAAEQMLEHGISYASFKGYQTKAAKLTEDYKFGLLAQFLCWLGKKARFFDAVVRLAKDDSQLADLLYAAVSAEQSYREIFWRRENFKLLGRLSLKFLQHEFRKIYGREIW